MFTKIDKNKYDFSTVLKLPASRWGDNPSLDQTGSTLHLSSYTKYDDQDILDWFDSNNIKWRQITRYDNRDTIMIVNEEDVLLFDLTYG